MDIKNDRQSGWTLVVVSVLVFISITIYRISNKLSPVKANTEETAACSSNVPAPAEVNKPDSLLMEQKQEISTQNTMETAPRIEAITISGSGKSGVFIRGNFAREGDIVDGFKILKIYPDKVEYEKDGKTITGVFPPPKTEKTEVPQSGKTDSEKI